jgi:hypothetical protein
MTSCPLSLKAISPHNSSQRDIKHQLKRMPEKISSQRGKIKELERERAKEREKNNAYIIL